MEEVRDQSYYPAAFKSFKVTSYDANNDPLVTKFFSDNDFTGEVFRWTQTWLADGKVESWKVQRKSEL